MNKKIPLILEVQLVQFLFPIESPSPENSTIEQMEKGITD
jgi:hypothetical protein